MVDKILIWAICIIDFAVLNFKSEGRMYIHVSNSESQTF